MANRRPGLETLEDRCLLNAGGLDPTFGTGGKVTTPVLAAANDTAAAAVYQPDGKLIVVGASGNGSQSGIAMARYNANGTLDTTFGVGGRVRTAFGTAFSIAGGSAVALQSNGKIVVAGTRGEGIVVARYNANGSLDTTFDGDGKATSDFAFTVTVNRVALDGAGRVVVAGHTGTSGTGGDYLVARFNANGSADTTFDGDGVAITNVLSLDFGRGLAIQPDNKIVVAGMSGTPTARDITLVRYNVNGSLDTTFDGDGKVITPLAPGAFEFTFAVTVNASTGNLRVAANTAGQFVLVDYNSAGALLGSTAPTAYGFTFSASTADFTASGKVVVAGTSSGDLAAARFNSNGTVDTTFNGTGRVVTSVGATDAGRGLALRPDGSVAVVGFTDSNANDFALAQYAASGTLSNTATTEFFISSLLAGSPPGDPFAGPPSGVVAVQLDGKVVVGGTLVRADFTDAFVVARYNVNGTLDSTFGSGGFAFIDFGPGDALSGITLDLFGHILVAGTTFSETSFTNDFAVARLLPNGALDTSFDGDGKATIDFSGQNDTAADIGVDLLGRAVVVGSTTEPVFGTNDYAVARLSYNGALDTSFNGTGTTTIGFGTAEAPTDDVAAGVAVGLLGRVTVVGTTFDPFLFTPHDIGVARLTSAGAPDGGFGTGGKAVLDFGGDEFAASVAVDLFGRTVIAGTTGDPFGDARDILVTRLTFGGAVDAGYGTGGLTLVDFGSDDVAADVAIDLFGRAVVVGTTGSVFAFAHDIGVARLTSGGALDTSFGTGGKVVIDFGGDDIAAGVALDLLSGRIVVGGNKFGENGVEFALARLLGEDDEDC